MSNPGSSIPSPGAKVPTSGFTCRNCATKYQTDFIFCPNCGSNLTIPREINITDVSFRDTVDEKYFELYEEIDRRVKEFDWLEAAVAQQDQLLETLRVEKARISLDIESLNVQVVKEKADVEALERLTWSSFRKKLTGSHADALKKEEEEYLEVMVNLDMSKAELAKTERKIITAKEDRASLAKAIKSRDQLIASQKEIFYKATQGIVDDEEDRIELRINELVKELDPFTIKKSRLQTAFSFLQIAQEDLRNASMMLSEPTDPKTIKKNALLMDVLTKSEVADIKSVVKEAANCIRNAYEILSKQVDDGEDLDGDGVHMGLFENQGLWARFMRNFMRDLKSGFRNREETREHLSKSVAEVNKLLAWVNSLLSEMNVKIDELMFNLRGLEQDLINQRRKIFERLYQSRG
ncbi:MAG: hypothetical protein ACXAE3_06710 [Candidatus Kariarchaeaceae archaeon]